MSALAFLDTNVLVYANSREDDRAEAARKLLFDGGVLSVQVLNEFVSVARARLRMSWPGVHEAVEQIVLLCPEPRSVSLSTHRHALKLSERYNFSIWDGSILASALDAGCTTLYTEDLQHGQVVEGLRIDNPFLGPVTP